MIDSKRLFLAIKIQPDREFLDSLNQLNKSLKHEQIRWVNTENLHLALRFFGETPIDRIQRIKDAVSKAFDKQSFFRMDLGNLGIFGSSYQPKVIWLGVRDPAILRQIESRRNMELQLIGFIRDRQNFVPHLSIGRIRRLKDKAIFSKVIEEFKEVFSQKSIVEELIIYESILQEKGSIYKVIQRFDLKA